MGYFKCECLICIFQDDMPVYINGMYMGRPYLSVHLFICSFKSRIARQILMKFNKNIMLFNAI
jgi:hypothetical protein